MKAVLGIAYRTNRQDDMDICPAFTQDLDSLRQAIDALFDREFFLLKQVLGAFLTIVHNLACLLKAIHMVGA